MSKSFIPHYDILPPEQQICWSHLQGLSSLGFVLYGGTALALRLGHRVSIDFDFFSKTDIDRKSLYEGFPFLEDSERLQDDGNTLTLSVSGTGFDNPVKISFFGGIDFGRVGTPEYAGESGILVASLDDIMALKLKVLLQRVEEKDYADIATMLRHGVSLKKGLVSAAEMFGTTFPPSIALHTLVWFEDLDDGVLTEELKEILLNEVEHFDMRNSDGWNQRQVVSHDLLP